MRRPVTTLDDYLERPLAAPAISTLEAIEAGPIDASDALPVAALDRLLDPAPLAAETGWCWTSERVAYVAVRTELRRTTGRMWDWWFDWHAHDPIRYRIWYPGQHFDISRRPPASPADKPLWGQTHYPIEDIGLGRQTIRIEFRRPTDYGFSTDGLADPRVATIVGGYVGRAHARAGVICHVFLASGDGLVLRSRFWLGSALRLDIPGPIGDALGRLINRPVVRRRVLASALPQRLARHCAVEYAHLGSILPELYARFA